MGSLWNRKEEIQFFRETLSSYASVSQLFYRLEDGYYAYVPKDREKQGVTLQSRNSLIGHYTENWCRKLLDPIARKLGLYAVNSVVCDEIGLPAKSAADVAFCTTPASIQDPENIHLIFEVKMSVVSNYKYTEPDNIEYVSDYKHHRGNPSLLRSDSMLKAIGKSLSIRVSSDLASTIPIIILGNSPISSLYLDKSDHLVKSGALQGIWSLNPFPASGDFIVRSPDAGFRTIENPKELERLCSTLVQQDLHYFSSMMTKEELGRIIRLSANEGDEIGAAERFLKYIRE